MKLSIIIVSYNVLPFLRQCIEAVMSACSTYDFEIIVVDNASQDGSSDYLSSLNNSNVTVILEDSNLGYGKAMNIGIQASSSDLLHLLNPDTIVTAESLVKSIAKLESDPKCGAVGVRMIDGQGNYLKESKRGYPTALSAFYKMIGLSRLFPDSKTFSHYHQGHLSPFENHKVDILTGAFLMTKRNVIQEVGGFDERYFMYGEDIDLSHSISEAGYYNYYIGDTSIIHFKGESSKKESLGNTYHFYNSMLLFTKKYSSGNFLFIGFLSVLLIMIGLTRWVKLNVLNGMLFLIRSAMYTVLFGIVSRIWAQFYFDDPMYFSYTKHYLLLIGYSVVMTVGYYVGNKRTRGIQNLLWTSIGLLVIYALLPLSLRSSRAVVLLGALMIIFAEIVNAGYRSWKDGGAISYWNSKKKALLLGAYDECSVVIEGLSTQQSFDYAGIVSDTIGAESNSLTTFDHLENYLSNNEIDTLTMHMESMPMERIMAIMSHYGPSYQYILYSSNNKSIIESSDSNTQGTVTLVEIRWAIDDPSNRIVKRAIDILASLAFILGLPLLIWWITNKAEWITNIFKSLIGKTSWVGYSMDDVNLDKLPKIKPAVVQLNHAQGQGHSENVTYARDYSCMTDISLIIKSFTALGNKVNFNEEH